MVTLAKTRITNKERDMGLACKKLKITTNFAKNIGIGGIAAIFKRSTISHNVIEYLE